MNIKYSHVNIVAKDWQRLAIFYQEVFSCAPILPQRDLSGIEIEEGTGVINASLKGVHLQLPGFDQQGPTLEIFQYSDPITDSLSTANKTGIRHLAFSCNDIEMLYQKALANGAIKLGKIVNKKIANVGLIKFVYIYDPEYNLIELQEWSNSIESPEAS